MARAVAHVPFDKKSPTQSAAPATAAQPASRDLSGRAAGHGSGYPLGESDPPAKSGSGQESADYPEPRLLPQPGKPSNLPAAVRDGLSSPAQPLTPAARKLMEPRFGYDLGRVRIHDGGPRGRRPPPREQLIEAGLASPSRPLSSDLQRDYSAKLGTDLSDVRVHAGDTAGAAATLLGARAFAHGNHLVFGPGRFLPDQPEGRRLLVHELAHVVQQRRPGALASTAQTENEAKAIAHAPAAAVSPPLLAAAGPQFDPLSDAEIARLQAEGSLDQLVARLQENESEAGQLVYSPDYNVELQRENLSLQRAIMALQQQPQASHPPPAPDQLVSLEPRLTSEVLHDLDDRRLEQLWVRVNAWLQAHLAPGSAPADTPEYRQVAALSQRISDERSRRAATQQATVDQTREQWEHDFALSQRTPGLLGLLLPAHTRPYYRDPTSEIRDPTLRLATGAGTEAFYGAAHLGRDVTAAAMAVTGAVIIIVAGGEVLSASLALAGDAAAETATGARLICFVYTNAQSITAITEFTVDQVFQIAAAGGIAAYLSSLRTPEGALNLGMSIFHLHIALGGSGGEGGPRRTATATAQIESIEGETITARVISPPRLEGEEGEAAPPSPATGGSRTAPPPHAGATPEPESSGGEAASPPSGATTHAPEPDSPPSPAAAAPAVASAPPPTVGPGRTAAQAATEYADRFGGRLVDDAGLEGIFERTRSQPTLAVDRRAAAAELGRIHDILTNGLDGRPVARVRVVPPTSTQRTPDLVVELTDGTNTRVEIRTVTSAPRGHSDPHAPLADATRARAAPLTQSQLEQAVIAKARTTPSRPSQLDVPLAGVSPEGTISIVAPFAPTDPAIVDAAVANIGPTLGSHVQGISFTFTGGSGRTTLVYHRQGSTFVR